MKDLFRKRWFFILLVLGVTLAWFRPEWLRPCTALIDPRIVVALALFLMAWGLESRHLFRSLLRPWAALWAAFVSYSAIPFLGWLGGRLLPNDDLRVGLMVISSAPCTLASAVLWTRLAGGNEATALLVVLITTATSWLVTTTWLAWSLATTVRIDTGAMMWSLITVLVIPVGVGQIIRAFPFLAQLAARRRRILGVVSRSLILSIVLKAVVDLSDQLGERPEALSWALAVATGFLVVASHLIGLAGGFWTAKWMKCVPSEQVAVAFACSQKTLPVSLYLFMTYFKDAYPLAILPLVFYHVGQLIVDTFIAEGLSKHAAT
ncbi:MAG TPA: bile acid:sodium symporter [Gemmataceae bacterium]|nr:bile acid:sodium symporter [Gemmataceae bacterium]